MESLRSRQLLIVVSVLRARKEKWRCGFCGRWTERRKKKEEGEAKKRWRRKEGRFEYNAYSRRKEKQQEICRTAYIKGDANKRPCKGIGATTLHFARPKAKVANSTRTSRGANWFQMSWLIDALLFSRVSHLLAKNTLHKLQEYIYYVFNPSTFMGIKMRSSKFENTFSESFIKLHTGGIKMSHLSSPIENLTSDF